MEETLEKIVGKNDLVEDMGKQDEKNMRYQAFSYVERLNEAARRMYCSKAEMSFDAMIENLTKALLKLKGNEKKLQKENKERALYPMYD